MSEEEKKAEAKKGARKPAKGNRLVAAVGTAAHGGAWHGPGFVIEVPEAEGAALVKSGAWKDT